MTSGWIKTRLIFQSYTCVANARSYWRTYFRKEREVVRGRRKKGRRVLVATRRTHLIVPNTFKLHADHRNKHEANNNRPYCWLGVSPRRVASYDPETPVASAASEAHDIRLHAHEDKVREEVHARRGASERASEGRCLWQ